jgi:hypothetical protein
MFPIKKCLACEINCLTCLSLNNCLVCNQSYFLFNGFCSKNCYDSTYYTMNQTSGQFQCQNCPTDCATCYKIFTCTSCQSNPNYNLYLFFNTTTNTTLCIKNCSINMFGAISGFCEPCSTNCDRCRSYFECIVCAMNYTLVNGYCQKENVTCSIISCL